MRKIIMILALGVSLVGSGLGFPGSTSPTATSGGSDTVKTPIFTNRETGVVTTSGSVVSGDRVLTRSVAVGGNNIEITRAYVGSGKKPKISCSVVNGGTCKGAVGGEAAAEVMAAEGEGALINAGRLISLKLNNKE